MLNVLVFKFKKSLSSLVQRRASSSHDSAWYNSKKWLDKNYVFYHKANAHLVAIKIKQ